MARRKNKKHDVFKFINMHGGDKNVCWEWTGSLGGRDSRPYFSYDGTKSLAYRLVYELVNGEDIPKGIVVRHTCDNKVCCNPAHLLIGTHQQNMDDMKQRERHGLPHHTIRAIKKLLEGNEDTHQQIADKFGVSRQLVTAINNNDLYSHVTDGEDDD